MSLAAALLLLAAQAAAVDQVGRREADVRPAQLAPPARDAGGAPPLSAPSQSRPPPSAAIGGRDRCDPPAPEGCERVLEQRASEFARPAPPRSPEARLLEWRGRAAAADADAAARAAAAGDPERSLALQAALLAAERRAEDEAARRAAQDAPPAKRR